LQVPLNCERLILANYDGRSDSGETTYHKEFGVTNTVDKNVRVVPTEAVEEQIVETWIRAKWWFSVDLFFLFAGKASKLLE
jgi:hypothetical protein